MPLYPEWVKEIGNDFELQFRFLILPEGSVSTVEKIISSGYPELDEIGARYMRRWKFMPVPEESPQEVQWEVIKLIFKLQ